MRQSATVNPGKTMDQKPSHESIQAENTNLKKQIETLKHAEKINYTLYDITNAVNTTRDLKELYQSIYESLNKLMPLPNFYIAIYDNKKKTIHFDYFIDEFDNDFPAHETLEEPDCLTGEVILARRPLFLRENMLIERARKNKVAGTVPKTWIGVPLIIQDIVIGIICAQHYSDPEYFSHRHLEILVSVSDQIAIAIERKQILDILEKKEKTLSLITEHTNSYVAIADSQGIYEFANLAHKNLGYECNDLIGSSFVDLIHSDDVEKLLSPLENGVPGSVSHVPMQFGIKDKSGNFCKVEGTFDLIWDEDGFLKKIVFLGRDISKKAVKLIRPLQALASSNNSAPSDMDIDKISPKRAKTILVIEDEDMVRDMVVKALKTFGYHTLDACDGQAGLDIFKKCRHSIDAVLLDIIMPKMSGSETFKQILNIDPNVKIIVASGHVTNQDQKKIFSKACAYLEKPYQIMELKQILDSVFK